MPCAAWQDRGASPDWLHAPPTPAKVVPCSGVQLLCSPDSLTDQTVLSPYLIAIAGLPARREAFAAFIRE